MNIFTLYHFGGSKRNLSFDAMMRARAAALYASKHDISSIFFVGGSFENHTSGAEQMRVYYEKISTVDLPLYVIGSINTESNISAIMGVINKLPVNELNIIITNRYHARRIRALISTHDIDIKVCEAEDILLEYGDNTLKLEVQKYVTSFRYKGMVCREYILNIFSRSFICQKILKIIRSISYK